MKDDEMKDHAVWPETKENGNHVTSNGVSNGNVNPAFELEPTDRKRDFSKIDLATPDIQFKDGKEKEKEEAKKMVGVFELFRFAEGRDILFMIIGTVGALGLGCMFPVMLLYFGTMIDSFAEFGLIDKLIASVDFNDPNNPTEDQIRADLTLLQPWLDASGLNGTVDLSSIEGDIVGVMGGLALIFLAIAAGALGFGYLQITFWTMSAERQIWKIRMAFFRSVMRQDIAWFDTNQPGQINTRLSGDVATVKTGLSDKVGGFFQWGSMFVGGIIIGFVQGWKLALVIMAASPLLVVGAILMSKMITSLTSEELGAYSRAGAVATEVLGSMRTVAAFGAEDREAKRYEQHLSEAKQFGIRRGITVGLSMGFTFCVFFLSYALGFWYGARLIFVDLDPHYSGGTVITVFLGIVMGSFSLGQAIPNYQALLQGRGAAYFIYNLIDRVPPIDSYSEEGEEPTEIVGDIELRDIKFKYPSRPDITVMDGMNINIKNGLTVALVGPSGCGKSTTVQLIQRFYDPDEGQVFLDGRNVRDLNLGWLRRHIGVVSQEPVLFDTTIAENIRYGRDDVDQAGIEAACKEANVHDFISTLPKGYETMVGERGAQLSGGQKQRIAIARALVRDPKILLLDEATSALDTESERIVQQALDKVRLGRTTLIIAHRLSTVQTADRIVAIQDGRAMEEGTHQELMGKKGLYYSLVTAQTNKQTEKEDAEEEQARQFSEKSELERTLSMKKGKDADQSEETEEDDKKKEKKEKEEGVMGRLLMMNMPELPLIIVGCISCLINGGMQPAYAIIFAEFIAVFGEVDPVVRDNQITFICVFFLVLAIVAFIANFLQVLCFAKSGEGLTERLRQKLFRAMLRQEMAYFDETDHNTGALTARLSTEAQAIQGASGARLGMMIQNMSNLITALVLAFYFGWQLTLVIICFIPFLIIGGAIEMKIMGGVANRDSAAVEDASKIVVEAVGNIRTVAQLTKEKTFYQLYEERLHGTHKKSLLQAHGMGAGYGMTQCFMYLMYAGAFYIGAIFIQQGWMTFEAVFRTFNVIVFGAMGLGQASAFAPDYAKAQAAGRKIFQLLDRTSLIDPTSTEGEKPESCEGNVEFKDVIFHYPTRPELTVLKKLNLNASSGDTVALVGSSGCGKSTTVQLIERFYDIEDGQVLIDGRETSSLNIKWLRQQIGIVSQEPVLFDLSLKQNIAYGLDTEPDMNQIIDAAIKANIHDFVSSLPLGYETPVGERGAQLSGGQKQRIAIARALVRDPKILLLDEATSALDTESERIVQQALDKVRLGRTTLIIAHRLSTVQTADRIVAIQDGRAMEEGTHQELMGKKGLYYSLVTAQTNKQTEKEDAEEEQARQFSEKSELERTLSMKKGKDADQSEETEEDDKKKEKKEKEEGVMGRLLMMNMPELPLIIVGCISCLINGGMQPAYAIIFAEFIAVFGEVDPVVRDNQITFICVFFLVLAIVAFIANFLQVLCFAKSGEGLTERLRQKLFRAMLRQEMAYFDETDHNTGALTARLSTEAQAIQGASGARLGMMIQNMSNLITALVLAFYFGWQLTLVIICFIPFLIIGGAIEMKIMGGVANRDSAAVEDASKIVVEAVGNIRTVAQLTKEKTFYQLYEERLHGTHKKSLLQAHGMGAGYGMTQCFMYLMYAGAFYIGAIFIQQGWMTFEAVFRTFNVIVFGAMGLGQASAFAPDYAKAQAAGRKIFQLLDRTSLIDPTSTEGEKPESCEGNVEFKDVIFHYPTRPELTVLKKLNLNASSGDTVALVGSSGCGKSTTVQLIERFYDIEDGQVLIDGRETSSLNIKWLRQQIGIVSQEPVLFDLSLKQNIAYGLDTEPDMNQIIDAAIKANIHDFVSSLPLGYETPVGERGAQLSGGQKQRIAIARALIRDPKILLLDEATSALDTESEKVVQEALDKAREGRTCLVIAHRLSTIKNSSRILVLQAGRVAESGTHQELMSKQGVYCKLNSAQVHAKI